MHCLEKRKLLKDMIVLFNYLKDYHIQSGVEWFQTLPEVRTRTVGFNDKEIDFSWISGKKILMTRAVQQWNRLPLEGVGSSSLEIFKQKLGWPSSRML